MSVLTMISSRTKRKKLHENHKIMDYYLCSGSGLESLDCEILHNYETLRPLPYQLIFLGGI